MTTPQIDTARLIRQYAQWALDECFGADDAPDPLLLAIVATDAGSAEACCHMGRALICQSEATGDAPYRLGGEMCDARVSKIARRLGMVP